MNRLVMTLAAAALALSAPALDDVRTDAGGNVWARQGSLGRNDYVLTNAPGLPKSGGTMTGDLSLGPNDLLLVGQVPADDTYATNLWNHIRAYPVGRGGFVGLPSLVSSFIPAAVADYLGQGGFVSNAGDTMTGYLTVPGLGVTTSTTTDPFLEFINPASKLDWYDWGLKVAGDGAGSFYLPGRGPNSIQSGGGGEFMLVKTAESRYLPIHGQADSAAMIADRFGSIDATGAVWRVQYQPSLDYWKILPQPDGQSIWWNGSTWTRKLEGSDNDTGKGDSTYRLSWRLNGPTVYTAIRYPGGPTNCVGVLDPTVGTGSITDGTNTITADMTYSKVVDGWPDLVDALVGKTVDYNGEQIVITRDNLRIKAYDEENVYAVSVDTGDGAGEPFGAIFMDSNLEYWESAADRDSATRGYAEALSIRGWYDRSRIVESKKLATKDDVAAKQDALPYPTNAIPASVVSGLLVSNIEDGTNLATKTELSAKQDALTDAQLGVLNGWPWDYNDLSNKPKIGGVELTGDKSLADIGAQAADRITDGTNTVTAGLLVYRDEPWFPKTVEYWNESDPGVRAGASPVDTLRWDGVGYVGSSHVLARDEEGAWIVEDGFGGDYRTQWTGASIPFGSRSEFGLTYVALYSAERRTFVGRLATTYAMTNQLVSLNQSVQYVQANGTTLQIAVPAATDGVRDWVVYVGATVDTALDFSQLPGVLAVDEAYTNVVKADSVTALWLTEMTNNVFVLGRTELKAIK